ncbi:GGDEF domain-containing protein [Caenispirillum bisanense]|uniref:GGDEF domain-containing protein n=1 Tax=Caenispirillum bisanense TaxID=414052 RepID=UPI0031DA502B
MGEVLAAVWRALGGDGQFAPHGMCLLWDPALVWTMLLSDVLIVLSYYSIPAALFLFLRRRPDLRFRGIFYLAGFFVLACGTTHLIAILTLWQPLYWLEAIAKLVTAAVSVATAVVAWPLLPKAIALPTPERLHETRRALREAQEMASRDPLTDLPNRRALPQLAAALAKAAPNRPVAVAMVDIDLFKSVNDTFGHGMGDALLHHVADVMRRCLGPSDTAVRFGGDEFVLVLPDADEDAAAATVAAVCRGIAVSPIWYEGQTVRLTASAGVAAARVRELDMDALIRRADRACYRAKAAGRDRVARDSDIEADGAEATDTAALPAGTTAA